MARGLIIEILYLTHMCTHMCQLWIPPQAVKCLNCFEKGSDDALVFVESEKTESDDDGTEEYEMEITEDMLQFFAASAKHRHLRGKTNLIMIAVGSYKTVSPAKKEEIHWKLTLKKTTQLHVYVLGDTFFIVGLRYANLKFSDWRSQKKIIRYRNFQMLCNNLAIVWGVSFFDKLSVRVYSK